MGKTSSNKQFTDSSSVSLEVSNDNAGCSGTSNGAEIPVKFRISPYVPWHKALSHLVSRTPPTGYSQKSPESHPFPIIFAAISRISLLGLMNAAIVIMPLSKKSFETSAMRRIFSTRSVSENPRLLLIPLRILSPVKDTAKQSSLMKFTLQCE